MTQMRTPRKREFHWLEGTAQKKARTFTRPAFYDEGKLGFVRGGKKRVAIEVRGSTMKRLGKRLMHAEQFRAAFPDGHIPASSVETRSMPGRLIPLCGESSWTSFEEGVFEVVVEGEDRNATDERRVFRDVEEAISAALDLAGWPDRRGPLPRDETRVPEVVAAPARFVVRRAASVREAMNRR